MSEFENIKEGDEVYIPGQYGAVGIMRPVTHVTPTTFTAWGRVFFKESGRQKGGSKWHSARALIPTPQIRDQILREERIDRLGNKRWENLTDAQLAAICAILDEAQGAK